MMHRFSCLFVLLAMLGLAGCEPEQQSVDAGFAGLGEQAEGFTQVSPDRRFEFPADHGAHPDYRIEWWYVTANLTDEDGREWGAQWTLFRQALQPQTPLEAEAGWNSAQVWLGHSAVTHADGHKYADRLARGGVGQAGVRVEPFEAWIDDWSLSQAGEAQGQDSFSALSVKAAGEDFSYQLNLTADRPVVPQGEQGYSRKSEGDQASYYYSQPFFSVEGAIGWEGQRHIVTGQAWLDREWSSQPLAANQQGWDWFSLHLDGGEKLMLFRLRSTDDSHYYSGTWIQPDGETQPLAPGAIELEPLDETTVAGREVPTRWRLRIPTKDFDVTTEPLNERAWMGTTIPYWEGPIRFGGSHTGVGYLEMTGY
ncbi:lipocalin-like domain-containing protein [Pseudomonas sp. OIL-1]|uniref:lipocalin-like domain-containing protein n=1 Tax=Pseudomonas sp. OIL-1 TaxID=2706126 RepID=UPI003531E8E8